MYDLPEEFNDLSESRQRKIYEYVRKERKRVKLEAQQDTIIAVVAIGAKTQNEVFSHGHERIRRYIKQWQHDIFDFYQDRDVREPQLYDWLRNLGFGIIDGTLEEIKVVEDDYEEGKNV